MSACDARAKRLADDLIRELGGDRELWFHEMRKVYAGGKGAPDLEALWKEATARFANAERQRKPGDGVRQSPLKTDQEEVVVPPTVSSVMAGRTVEEAEALLEQVRLQERAGREGPVNPEARARHDTDAVDRVLGASRQPSKMLHRSNVAEGLMASFSYQHEAGVFKKAWRVTMAAAQRAIDAAGAKRRPFAERLLGDIFDEPGRTAKDKLLDAEAIIVLRDLLARHGEDTRRAQADLPDVIAKVKALKAELDAQAASGKADPETAAAYGKQLKAMQMLAEVSEKGVALPGDLRPQEIQERLDQIEKSAHKDTFLIAARFRTMLDEAADSLVERGLLSERSRRKDYFPHKLIEGFMFRKGSGGDTPARARSQQFRGYTKISRSNRRLVDTNVTEVVLSYLVEVERHNALDAWYDREVRRYAVPSKGKKAVPLEGEFTEAERVAMREGAWLEGGKDRTAEWYDRLPNMVREQMGTAQGVLRAPNMKEMRATLREYADSGGYVDVNASWGTLRWGLAEQSPEVRRMLEELRQEGWPLPDMPEVGAKRFGRGRGTIRVHRLVAERVMQMRDNPSIYPAERWINRFTSAFKRNVTVTFGGFSYYARNWFGDHLLAIRDDTGAQREAAGSVLAWKGTAKKIGRYKALHDKLGSPLLGAKDRAEIQEEASRLEAQLRAIDERIPEWVDQAFSFAVIGSGFTAEDAASGRSRIGAMSGLERFSGLAGEGRLRQAMDKLAPMRYWRHFADWLGQVNQRREDTLRTAKYVRDMMAGLKPHQAVTINHQTFIHYGALTDFERRWFSRAFVPFWTWTKSNAVGWSMSAKERPLRTAAYMAISVGLTNLWNLLLHEDEEERIWTSPYTRHIAQKPHLILPFNDASGNPIVLTFDDPLMDALGIVGADEAPGLMQRLGRGENALRVFSDAVASAPVRASKELVERLNPLVTTLYEAASGREYFTGRRLWSESDSGPSKLGTLALRAIKGANRGAAEIARFGQRAERSGLGAALARSPLSPTAPFIQAPDIASNLTMAEKEERDRINRELVSEGYARSGERDGEVDFVRGATKQPGVKEKQRALRLIDARRRVRGVVQLVKAGRPEDAAQIMGGRDAFRSLLSLLPVEERVALRETLEQHGTSLDAIAKHTPFTAAGR